MIEQGSFADRIPKHIPTWNTLGRPKKVKIATIGFNLETNKLEIWSGTKWLSLPMKKIEVE
jgi:hypothetical protein